MFGRVAWCLRMAHRAAVRCQGTNITFLYETVIHFEPPPPPHPTPPQHRPGALPCIPYLVIWVAEHPTAGSPAEGSVEQRTRLRVSETAADGQTAGVL